MRGYESYPEYRVSSVEWLGTVPKHWDMLRLKYSVELAGEKSDYQLDSKYVGLENISSGDGKRIELAEYIPDGLANAFDVTDVLFGKLRPYLAKAWMADFSGLCSSEFLVMKSRKVCPAYLKYWVLAKDFVDQVNSSTYGSKMPRANWEFIGNLVVPRENGEQQKIANFLDHETAKIDTLIEKQQQLIKLLKEKSQAVISHAVTKGLNPDAPMKDSGVEWLGEVPAGWISCKLRRHVGFVDGDRGKEYPGDGDIRDEGILFLSSKNIANGVLDLKDTKFIASEKFERLNRGKAEDGDLVVKVRGSVGRIGETAIFEVGKYGYETAFINAQMMIIRTRASLLGCYLHLISQGTYWIEQLNVGAYGTAQQQLSNEVFANVFVVVPSVEEQNMIVKEVRARVCTIDDLMQKSQSAIKLMQERRTALISAAVTGKIDVRNWQASEPTSTPSTEA